MASYSVQLQLFDLPSGNSPLIKWTSFAFFAWCLLNARRSQANTVFDCWKFEILQKLKENLKEKAKRESETKSGMGSWGKLLPKSTPLTNLIEHTGLQKHHHFTGMNLPGWCVPAERLGACVWTKGGRPNRPPVGYIANFRKINYGFCWND